MKKFLLGLFLLVALSGSAIAIYAAHVFTSAGPLQYPKIVDLPRGSGVIGMARILQQQNIITDPYVFAAYARLTGSQRKLQAGEYQFPAHICMSQAMAKIARGEVYRRAFTIPEGKTSFEIVQIINAVPNMTGEIQDIPADGSLLPNTYDYRPQDTRRAKIAQMQAAMTKTIAEVWAARPADAFVQTPEQMVTLASVVEKETGVASERAKVAGVFLNRLKINMPLQSDPTVIYGLTKGQHQNAGQGPLGRRLLTSDLATPNPYNTYLNAGLPPGPICNPGRASLTAVLHPEQHEFLYFVADGKGGHVFAKTLAEHNQNVTAWRAARARMKKQ